MDLSKEETAVVARNGVVDSDPMNSSSTVVCSDDGGGCELFARIANMMRADDEEEDDIINEDFRNGCNGGVESNEDGTSETKKGKKVDLQLISAEDIVKSLAQKQVKRNVENYFRRSTQNLCSDAQRNKSQFLFIEYTNDGRYIRHMGSSLTSDLLASDIVTNNLGSTQVKTSMKSGCFGLSAGQVPEADSSLHKSTKFVAQYLETKKGAKTGYYWMLKKL